MIENLTRTVAYICPVCAGATQKQIGIFRFSGDNPSELICSGKGCGELCVTIVPSSDKYRISLECAICGETHMFTISKQAFWHKELLTFACPNTGLDIFFSGTKQNVTKALDESNKLIGELTSEINEEDIQFIFTLIDRLHYIIETGKIVCRCGEKKVIPQLDKDKIVISCPKCGNTLELAPDEELMEKLMQDDIFTF